MSISVKFTMVQWIKCCIRIWNFDHTIFNTQIILLEVTWTQNTAWLYESVLLIRIVCQEGLYLVISRDVRFLSQTSRMSYGQGWISSLSTANNDQWDKAANFVQVCMQNKRTCTGEKNTQSNLPHSVNSQLFTTNMVRLCCKRTSDELGCNSSHHVGF